MQTLNASTLSLSGSSYDIGFRLGKTAAAKSPLKAVHSSGVPLGKEDASLAQSLFDEWCPGLNEEIHGFADALGIAPTQMTYYAFTYLIPRCSQIAIMPDLSENGHVLLARSYEFHYELDDLTLVKTSASGKYAHIGSSVLSLGRDEGFNEHGLGVTMSSCGIPVGASESMRRPQLRGLQFWAVIRALLENCKDVSEALLYLKDMPIAYNINLILADRTGHAALFETLDGRSAYRLVGNTKEYLCATNHVLLDALKPFETMAMSNSINRVSTIQSFIDAQESIAADDLKALLLTNYPDGLCCHDYKAFFGTTKSMIMDLNDGTIEVCWGGQSENGWQAYSFSAPFKDSTHPIGIEQRSMTPDFFTMKNV